MRGERYYKFTAGPHVPNMVLQLGEGVCHEGFSEWGCADIRRVVAKRARVHGLVSLVNEKSRSRALRQSDRTR